VQNEPPFKFCHTTMAVPFTIGAVTAAGLLLALLVDNPLGQIASCVAVAAPFVGLVAAPAQNKSRIALR
jgi:hypothetical protein